jgi:hypothetical protein
VPENHLEQWRIQMLESLHKGPTTFLKRKSKTGDIKKIKASLQAHDPPRPEISASFPLSKKKRFPDISSISGRSGLVQQPDKIVVRSSHDLSLFVRL